MATERVVMKTLGHAALGVVALPVFILALLVFPPVFLLVMFGAAAMDLLEELGWKTKK